MLISPELDRNRNSGRPSRAERRAAWGRWTLARFFASVEDPFIADRLEIARRVEKLASVALVGLVCLLPFRSDVTWVDYSLYPSIAGLLAVMYVLRPRWPELAGFVGGVGFIALVTVAAWFRQGFASGVTSGAYALAVVVAGLLWGPRRTLPLAVLASVAAGVLLWYSPVPGRAPLRSWGEVTAILVTLALFVELALGALIARTTDALDTRRRFAQLFDASPDALILVDAERRVQLFNHAAAQLLGRVSVTGEPLASFEAFAGSNAQVIDLALGGDRGSLPPSSRGPGTPERTVSFAEGRFHELAATPLGESRDRARLWLLTIRDVTERVKAARARHEFEAQLSNSKSLESLGRLAGGVAHDFNNLLTVILGTTDLVIATSHLDERARNHLQSVQAAALRAAELTGQLLAFGRKQVLEPTVFCPNTSLVHLGPLFERLIPETIELRMDAATELGFARIDPARLEQVLVNLVTNACDAMPSGGTLTLETRNRDVDGVRVVATSGEVVPAGQYVCIDVADTGSGMDQATMAQIFEPFFTTKAMGKGTGLGLATVFGIVRQSGGYIRVHSRVGAGTRFELLFPRVSGRVERSEARGEKNANAPAGALSPLAVLLVEDDSSVRASVRAMLETLGHRVVEAGNGQDAWLLIERRDIAFDLLLTDVVMPNRNGLELASELRARQSNAKVLFMTGYGQGAFNNRDGSPEVLLDDGSAYLPKPFTTHSLAGKLAELFGESSRINSAAGESSPPLDP